MEVMNPEPYIRINTFAEPYIGITLSEESCVGITYSAKLCTLAVILPHTRVLLSETTPKCSYVILHVY